jgi:hypothetical protein
MSYIYNIRGGNPVLFSSDRALVTATRAGGATEDSVKRLFLN